MTQARNDAVNLQANTATSDSAPSITFEFASYEKSSLVVPACIVEVFTEITNQIDSPTIINYPYLEKLIIMRNKLYYDDTDNYQLYLYSQCLQYIFCQAASSTTLDDSKKNEITTCMIANDNLFHLVLKQSARSCIFLESKSCDTVFSASVRFFKDPNILFMLFKKLDNLLGDSPAISWKRSYIAVFNNLNGDGHSLIDLMLRSGNATFLKYFFDIPPAPYIANNRSDDVKRQVIKEILFANDKNYYLYNAVQSGDIATIQFLMNLVIYVYGDNQSSEYKQFLEERTHNGMGYTALGTIVLSLKAQVLKNMDTTKTIHLFKLLRAYGANQNAPMRSADDSLLIRDAVAKLTEKTQPRFFQSTKPRKRARYSVSSLNHKVVQLLRSALEVTLSRQDYFGIFSYICSEMVVYYTAISVRYPGISAFQQIIKELNTLIVEVQPIYDHYEIQSTHPITQFFTLFSNQITSIEQATSINGDQVVSDLIKHLANAAPASDEMAYAPLKIASIDVKSLASADDEQSIKSSANKLLAVSSKPHFSYQEDVGEHLVGLSTLLRGVTSLTATDFAKTLEKCADKIVDHALSEYHNANFHPIAKMRYLKLALYYYNQSIALRDSLNAPKRLSLYLSPLLILYILATRYEYSNRDKYIQNIREYMQAHQISAIADKSNNAKQQDEYDEYVDFVNGNTQAVALRP